MLSHVKGGKIQMKPKSKQICFLLLFCAVFKPVLNFLKFILYNNNNKALYLKVPFKTLKDTVKSKK